jgi:prepilin-type N-terminal cleavage/methylation domain-containing protein
MIFKRKFQNGFTLVELLVTITIFVLLTGVVLFNQGKFNSSILLTNLAYDTALTIRQAQTYGINIKEFYDNGTSSFVPYGVHFDLNYPTSFILYADLEYKNNNTYNPYDASADKSKCEPEKGCVNRYTIKRGNKISGLCVFSGVGSCLPTDSLDIVYQRPNPYAQIINANNNRGFSRAQVTLSSADNQSERVIDISANGLIQINDQL